ncbi:hypothetical protein [Ralstonia sp. 1B3]|uniref:hypothetical protein n=1 Tax=Ralstonia sp. 1B3 TaxID=2997421 RepID=UPI002FC98A07
MRLDGLAVPALDGALNFCCREEKERRLFERSEFASSPSLRHKFKESFAISGALSLLTFFGKTKKVSQPRQGMKQRMHQQSKTKSSPLDHQNTTTGDPSPFLQETKT